MRETIRQTLLIVVLLVGTLALSALIFPAGAADKATQCDDIYTTVEAASICCCTNQQGYTCCADVSFCGGFIPGCFCR